MLLNRAVEVLEDLYPLEYAEDWDAPGLIVGDPLDEVTRLAITVDPTMSVVEKAIAMHADLLICHHPLFFHPVHEVSGMGFRGQIVARLYRSHCALWVGHTNVDAAPRGVGQAAADAFGLTDQRPLIEHPHARKFPDPDVMVETKGEHRFGLGRVGRLEQPMSLAAFARLVATTLPHTELGVQVAGDPNMEVCHVAVLPGSGDSLIDEARAAGVDAYVTSDLRHHPTVDAMQQAANEARLRQGLVTSRSPYEVQERIQAHTPQFEDLSGAYSPRPALINTPHSAIESMWTSTYALSDIPQALRAVTGELVPIEKVDVNTDPWIMKMTTG